MISPIDLKDEAKYQEIATLSHDDIAPFVKEQIAHRNSYTLFYFRFNVLMMFVLIVWLFFDISKNHLEMSNVLMYLGIGVLASFTIMIPIHELIHGITYKLVGAPKVSYGGSFKKFVFYAAADKFVIGRRNFKMVALAPFVIVTSIAILSLLFVGPYYKWISLGIIFAHTALCGGDFGMISFFEKNREKELYTYDDIAAKISYFYEKI